MQEDLCRFNAKKLFRCDQRKAGSDVSLRRKVLPSPYGDRCI